MVTKMMDIASQIRAARQRLDLTQKQAAEAWGVNVRTLESWAQSGAATGDTNIFITPAPKPQNPNYLIFLYFNEQLMKSAILICAVAMAEAKHHHHHRPKVMTDTKDLETLNAMPLDKLINGMSNTLSLAQKDEAAGDTASAVAKTAAIKNIQKALTARILKRLDDGQPLVEVARKMKAIEGMQPQINDMERRLGIMQSVEPVLENAIKTLQKVVDIRGMGKK